MDYTEMRRALMVAVNHAQYVRNEQVAGSIDGQWSEERRHRADDEWLEFIRLARQVHSAIAKLERP